MEEKYTPRITLQFVICDVARRLFDSNSHKNNRMLFNTKILSHIRIYRVVVVGRVHDYVHIVYIKMNY